MTAELERDAVEEMLHAEEMADVRAAAALLNKLNVAELRVLYLHLFKISSEGLRKEHMIEEIAAAHSSTILDKAW